MSRKRLIIALVIAGISDTISVCIDNPATPMLLPLQWVLDIATAIALFILLGWRWSMLGPLILEALPGVGVLPLWLLVVAWIGAQDERERKLKEGQAADGPPPVTQFPRLIPTMQQLPQDASARQAAATPPPPPAAALPEK